MAEERKENMGSDEEQDFPGHLLHQAALWDNEDLLLDLLNGDLIQHINSQDSWGRTPLHASSTTESSKCLKLLLKFGANPNIASGAQDNFKTPLHTCAEHGLLNNAKKLIEAGADAGLAEGHGMTAIDLADEYGHFKTRDFLKSAVLLKEEARENLHSALRESVSNSEITTVRDILAEIGTSEAQIVVNMTPNGSNTLLFKACENGKLKLVEILLEYGADGRIHPVTKYSPLYIACYHGHKEIVNVLLKRFPVLVQVQTVEKWLPLHASCINGHASVLELLLKFDYPLDLMITFRHFSGELEYDMPFDVNFKDVSDQNALYIACQMGNQRLVDILLKYRVEARKAGEGALHRQKERKADNAKSKTVIPEQEEEVTSPTKRKISHSIQGIISRLSKVSNQSLSITPKKQKNLVCPLNINDYCEECQTPLHVAVKQKNHVIANALLSAKADPNLPILPRVSGPSDYNNQFKQNKNRRNDESSTALVEACLLRDLGMIELLLKHGARDDDSKAAAIVQKDDVIMGKILSLRAHQDVENKINHSYLTENILSRLKKPLLASSILPTVSVTINWHGQKIDHISDQWLVAASLKLNPRLRLCPRNQMLGLQAITRIDLSQNKLENIPPLLFSICSLKYLNLSQNKLSGLEFPSPIILPWLEELSLQENRFDSIPEELFTCAPSLTILNLANNKLTCVPSTMWSAPKLQELNLSLNLLSELPSLSACLEASVFESILFLPTNQSPTEYSLDINTDSKKTVREQPIESNPVMLHHARWMKSVSVLSNSDLSDGLKGETTSCLVSLNLSHNSFRKVPKLLACLGTNIQRLNLSYNNLTSMGNIENYPSSIRQLDLSHNQIESWFAEPLENTRAKFNCYACPNDPPTDDICLHKKHSRLDLLKTLLISDNYLKRIELSYREESSDVSESPGSTSSAPDTPKKGSDVVIVMGKTASTSIAVKNLWLPNLTMLDISDNKLTEVNYRIFELSGLSVLNLSGNAEVTDLPPQMGLLNRMWNLNINGCNLQEPLKSMIESKKCKTMDIIGYLKSVLEDAKAYSRMKLMVVGIQGIGKTSLLTLLRQEGSSKHAIQDHWAKRMGTATKGSHKSGKPISTVGVDIGSLVLENKFSRASSSANSIGPVTFRTWDFGGQKEYYATHLYFLSKRSLYLVVWNICDGEKGLNEMTQWLVNIQARAPNSPVIIVGTHYDLVSEKFPPGYLDHLQQKIKDNFICVPDPEKRGLPRVVYSIEISCKNKYNIKQLCHLIYETVVNIKISNGKRLLEQKIPSKYIHLEEIVAYIAIEKKSKGLDPVMDESEFKPSVSSWLERGFGLNFRDDAEIMQACSFLHENGVLLHYDDSNLRDLYFLDPQWLCDMLAHVVTVREINPFVKNGIMKIEDLCHIFKGQSEQTKDYIISLLSKFELAVPWDSNNLLIPSLLPSHDQMKMGLNEVRVKVPIRSRAWALKSRPSRLCRNVSQDSLKSFHSPTSPGEHSAFPNLGSLPKSNTMVNMNRSDGSTGTSCYKLVQSKRTPLRRFLLLSYFPSGFWPRLISRVLADDRMVEIIRNYYDSSCVDLTPEVVSVLDQPAEWHCWQTGMELKYGDSIILRLREVSGEKPYVFMLRRNDGALCETEVTENLSFDSVPLTEESPEQIWDVVDLSESGLLDVYIPGVAVSIQSEITSDASSPEEAPECKNTILETSVETLSKILALTVDQIDTLLEDWYPSIGTRFVHTSEGKYLVTRLIPCPKCYPSDAEISFDATRSGTEKFNVLGSSKSQESSFGFNLSHKLDFLKNFGIVATSTSPRMSSDSGFDGNSPRETKTSSSDAIEATEDFDNERSTASGVKMRVGSGDSNPFRMNYAGLNYFAKGDSTAYGKRNSTIYSWSVEYCMLHSQKSAFSNSRGSKEDFVLSVKCPKHGDILLSEISPDILFMDLNPKYLLNPEQVQRGRLVGFGASGSVFSGNMYMKNDAKPLPVAIKTFQPIDPGPGDSEAQNLFKVARSKWLRSPAQSACRAYIAARGEVRVLYWVSHPHVVPFLGLYLYPLAIVMPIAPKGALDSVLSDFKRSGDKVQPCTVQMIIIQISKALEYLHSNRIIYRDLKSENVLVWNFPQPFGNIEDQKCVDIKLADYGISRSTFLTGSKGFGGTEGFMAPEIIRHNGEEEYTEKVDIFSFGMLMYEVLSLKQPFDGYENVKESILEGMRPALTQRDCDLYPLYMLDLMVTCWSHLPKDRPSASHIVSAASSPEFNTIKDVISLVNVTNIVSATGLRFGGFMEIWAACSTGGIYCLKLDSGETAFDSCHCFEFISGVVTAMCQVNDFIWMGDTLGKIYIFRMNDYSRAAECELEPVVGYCGAIVSIKCVQALVAVALSSGRLFLCDSKTGEPVTELGKSAVIHCLSTRVTSDGLTELWTGEKIGQMSVYTIKDGAVTSQDSINHYEHILEGVEVLLLDSHENNELIFSYVYPGSVIYGWECSKREMVSRLDVGKLLPVREAIEEDLNSKPLQVTVLRSSLNEVYIGTNWGSIFIASVKNLRPLTSFRPFTADARSFWIFYRDKSETLDSDSVHSFESSSKGLSDDNAKMKDSNSDDGSVNSELAQSLCPSPSFTETENESVSQIVIGIGKGFSDLIEHNIGIESTDRSRRRAYAILLDVKNNCWNE